VIWGCDPKHAFKRTRTALKSASRGCVIHAAFTFEGKNTYAVFLKAMGVDEATITAMFAPEDEQNVPYLVKFLKEMGNLRDKEYGDYTFEPNATQVQKARYRQMIKSIKILAHICHCQHTLLTRDDLNLNGHLTNLATMAGLLFVVYRKQGNKFLPAQNYHNLMSIVKVVFKAVLQAQIESIDEVYVYQLGDDRLEGLFGILRSLAGAGRNFDALQLEERINIAAQIAYIFTKRPDWDRGSRRLNGSLDRWNPKSWRGCVDPKLANVRNSWDNGLALSGTILQADGLFSATETNFTAISQQGNGAGVNRNFTIYCPDGVNTPGVD
jgi:hypothetical protein